MSKEGFIILVSVIGLILCIALVIVIHKIHRLKEYIDILEHANYTLARKLGEYIPIDAKIKEEFDEKEK